MKLILNIILCYDEPVKRKLQKRPVSFPKKSCKTENSWDREGMLSMELLENYRLVDLTVPIKTPNSEEMDPKLATSLAAEIEYLDHEDTIPLVSGYFGCRPEDLHGGCGWATERVRTSTHAGTHVDAPWHYAPASGGKPSRRIDECPLEWYFGRGVVLNMTHKKSGETVSAQDVKDALAALDYTLSYGDIVCIRYDTDKTFGTAAYWGEHPGLSAEAVRFILDQGVKVIGVDSPGFDIPFAKTKAKFADSHDKSILWEAHCAGIDYDYSHIEKLGNLDKVPEKGFYISCFPVNLYQGSASWSRVVAFVPKDL